MTEVPRVFCIDDSPTVHARMSHLIREWARYVGYVSWDGALKRLLLDKPRVVLIDLNLQGRQGEEIVQLVLRARRMIGSPAIFIFSSCSTTEIRARVPNPEIGILPKTFDGTMIALIRDSLGLGRMPEER